MWGTTLKLFKKIKFKRIYLWLLVDLAIVLFVLSLLLYRPASFKQLPAAEANEVSRYLTHQLMPQLYNGAQLAEPFNLVVDEDGVNDIIAHYDWPIRYDETILSAPVVFFTADYIEITGAVVTRGVELVVTVRLEPALDAAGLLNLHIAKVKIGAMNITPIARIIASKMYESRLAENNVDSTDIGVLVAASLLTDQPFDPVFTVDDKKVRLAKITHTRRELTLGLTPVPD